MGRKRRFKRKVAYVVWVGHECGVFTNWERCKKSVSSYPGAKYKGFTSLQDARKAYGEPWQQHIGEQKGKYLKQQKQKVPSFHKVMCDCCSYYFCDLLNATQVYKNRPDLKHKWFYVCPQCYARVGTHPDGRPLGPTATEQLRKARMRAHASFDRLWKEHGMKRSEAYAWLAGHLGIDGKDCHIGHFGIDECEAVVEVVEEFLSPASFDVVAANESDAPY